VTDVLKDFRVVVETADGTLHTHSSEAFRLAARCPSTLLLSTCVARYNARMVREGINERARLVPACRKCR
jgi:hypothetical protein